MHRVLAILTFALVLALVLASPVRAELPEPDAVWVPGVPAVMQMNNYSCGVAAVQSVAQRWGSWGYQTEWAEVLGTSYEEGTHPKAMVDALKDHGVEARLVEGMSLDQLQDHIRTGDVVIVDFQAWGEPAGKDYTDEWEDGHYGIAVGFDAKHLYIEDPSLLGTIGYLTHESFLSRWHDYENEDGKRREYRHMAIVCSGTPKPPPRFTPIE